MTESIGYRPMRPEEVLLVSRMIVRVFLAYSVPGYSLAGIREFLAFVAPAPLVRRQEQGEWLLLAVAGDLPVGMIEVRADRHIALLFVDERWQRQGIATALVERAKDHCRRQHRQRTTITVNSSSYAIPFYTAVGFTPFVEQQERNGIHYRPMVASLI